MTSTQTPTDPVSAPNGALQPRVDLVVRLRGGPRPMSVVVKAATPGSSGDFMAPFGPDDTARFTGVPAGRARDEISRHGVPPMLALRTVELKGGVPAEVEVVLDTLVDCAGHIEFKGPAGLRGEVFLITQKGKSVSTALPPDGNFRFRDVAEGPCTIEVKTFDKAQLRLYSRAFSQSPGETMDIEVDATGPEVPSQVPPPVPAGPPAPRPATVDTASSVPSAAAPVKAAPAPAKPAPVKAAPAQKEPAKKAGKKAGAEKPAAERQAKAPKKAPAAAPKKKAPAKEKPAAAKKKR